MIPHLFYYQLVVLGLLWLCIILGLDHGVGHLGEMMLQKRSASTAVWVETRKLPRHP